MMTEVELSISSTYVPGWTIVDAIRELFQNALDQETQHSDTSMYWAYDNGTLIIANNNTCLDMKSLLLGSSTKTNVRDTIGQFGEGYKLASLVLLRDGYDIAFYNNGVRQLWKPRLKKSRRFGTDVLTFRIYDDCKECSGTDLVIEVTGISDETFETMIAPSNLHMQDNAQPLYSTPHGDIINQPGRVYVNGLYVCTYTLYQYGYNFKPGGLNLDRDRKLASDFDLKWLASKTWACEVDAPEIMDLITSGAADVEYLTSTVESSTKYSGMRDLYERAYQSFVAAYGANAVPVTYESDFVPGGYTKVIVPDLYKRLIKMSLYYQEPVGEPGASPIADLDEWHTKYQHLLSVDAAEELRQILHNLKERYEK